MDKIAKTEDNAARAVNRDDKGKASGNVKDQQLPPGKNKPGSII